MMPILINYDFASLRRLLQFGILTTTLTLLELQIPRNAGFPEDRIKDPPAGTNFFSSGDLFLLAHSAVTIGFTPFSRAFLVFFPESTYFG